MSTTGWILGLTLWLACGLWPSLARAQCSGLAAPPIAFAWETLTISSTAKSLTKTIYQPPGTVPILAIVTLEGGNIRYLETGTPTATSGHVLSVPVTTSFNICGLDSITHFQAIRVTTDVTATVTYYKIKTP